MASRIQTASAASRAGGGVSSLSVVFGSDVTLGNTIVVFARAANAGGSVTSVTTGLSGTTFTTGPTAGISDPFGYAYYAVAGASGACTVTINFASGNGIDVWGYALEYSGLDALYDSGASRVTSGATIQAPNVDAPDDAIIIAAASLTGFSGFSYTFTAGTDFTLVDGAIGTGGSTYGGVQEWLGTTALTAATIEIVGSTTGTPFFVWMVFEAAPVPPIVGSAVFGQNGSVSSSRTFLANLDGVVRTVNMEQSHAIGGNLALIEQGSAPTGAANVAKLYAIDNGSGKTRLMVIFGSGSAIELAIEP